MNYLLFLLRVKHFHKQCLRWSTSPHMFIIEKFFASHRQSSEFWHLSHQLAELVLQINVRLVWMSVWLWFLDLLWFVGNNWLCIREALVVPGRVPREPVWSLIIHVLLLIIIIFHKIRINYQFYFYTIIITKFNLNFQYQNHN